MIKLKTRSLYLGEGLNHVVKEIEGKIYSKLGNDKNIIGKITGTYFDLQKAKNFSTDDLLAYFDSDSEKLSEYFANFYYDVDGPEYQYLRKHKNWDSKNRNNLLFLDTLVIHSKYRGQEKGLSAMCEVVKRYEGHCKVAALKVTPLQFSPCLEEIGDVDLLSFVKDEVSSIKKLKSYYAKLGFESIPDSDYMVLDLAR
ncbi:MAG: hypothetical protein K0R98_1060 [Rickettsiaceae bacterium]|jgi:hypothetical protein|nr:hypothetical protein [Rickettsiaceae bacterium]